MNKQGLSRVSLAMLLILVTLIVLGPEGAHPSFLMALDEKDNLGKPASLDAFDSPLPTPTPSYPDLTQRALRHIAEREGIPLEHLVAVNQHQRDYELLGRSFWFVTALDTVIDGVGDGFYNVMVDLTDGSFVDDRGAIEQAERGSPSQVWEAGTGFV